MLPSENAFHEDVRCLDKTYQQKFKFDLGSIIALGGCVSYDSVKIE